MENLFRFELAYLLIEDHKKMRAFKAGNKYDVCDLFLTKVS